MTSQNKMSVYVLAVMGLVLLLTGLFTKNVGMLIAGPCILVAALLLSLYFKSSRNRDRV